MKFFFIPLLFLLAYLPVTSQTKLTLQQAIQTGIENNLEVNQAGLQSQKANITLRQSKAAILPNLNAFSNQGINQGRTNDPITNAFINQNVNSSSYGISSSVLLFNGSALQNNIKANSLAYQASTFEFQQAKDNLTINIILAYLQVLSAEDILAESRNQDTTTKKQVERLNILNKAGAITPSDFYDLKGQLANDEIAIADNYAALETDKLNLVQLLNIPYDKNLEVERLPEQSFNVDYEDAPDKIYSTALKQFAQIKAVHLRTESAQKNIRAIQGQLYPSLYLNGTLNTNFSSAARQSFLVNSTEQPSSDYIVINGLQVPVITKQDNFNTQKITYNNQINNNLASAVYLGLTVPVFNGSLIRSKVKLAKIDLKNAEFIEQNTKTVLQQSIERAYVNLSNTYNKYKILLDQVNSFTESFRTAEIRFNAGATTSVPYLIAKNNLDKTNTNLITAKYDFVLRIKILDYYQGKIL